MSQEHTIEYRLAVEKLVAVEKLYEDTTDWQMQLLGICQKHPAIKDEFSDILQQSYDFQTNMRGLIRDAKADLVRMEEG